MTSLLSGLRTVAQEAPWLLAVLAVIGVAGLIAHALDYRAARKSKEYEDDATVRRRQAMKLVNDQIERETRAAIRSHEWH